MSVDRDLLPDHKWEDIAHRAADVPNGIGRLWRIESPGGATSHLWGTAHIPDVRISNVPDAVKERIRASRLVALEFVAAETTMAELEQWMDGATAYSFPPDPVYRDIPREAMAAIAKRLEAYAFFPEDIADLNPIYVLELLLHSACSDRLLSAGYPVQDVRIELIAADEGIELRGLEPRQILHELRGDPIWRGSLADVLTLFALYQEIPETTSTFFTLYLQGRIAELMAFDGVYLQERFPDLDLDGLVQSADAFLLDYRNEGMIGAIQHELETGGVFIAVGTYHLPGNAGLVALLRQDGFVVERVVVEGEVP